MVRRTSSSFSTASTSLPSASSACPGFVGERLGDARMLGDAVDAHVEVELDIGEARHAGDRRRVAEMRRGGKRHMALAGQQAGRRVEPDPAGAGQIDLAPGVQVGEVDRRCRAGRRARRGRASAGSGSRKRSAPRGRDCAAPAPAASSNRGRSPWRAASVSSGVLHAGFHADDVADLALHAGVEVDDEVDGVGRRAVDRGEEGAAAAARPAPASGRSRGRRGFPPDSRTARSRPTARRRSRTDCRPSCRRRDRPRSSVPFTGSGKTKRARKLP